MIVAASRRSRGERRYEKALAGGDLIMERQQQVQVQEQQLAPMLRSGQEGMPSFYRFLIVLAVYITAIIVTAVLLWLAAMYIFNRVLFDALVAAIAEIWMVAKFVVVAAVAIALIGYAGRVVTGIMASIPKPQIATFEETENVVVYGPFQSRQYSYVKSPVAHRQASKSRLGKTKIELVPPSIALQIQSGLVALDMPEVIHGFDAGNMAPIQLQRPYSSLTIGGTGSGKTRANTWRMAQRVLVNSEGGDPIVTVCDPHFEKSDGLASMLEAIGAYIKIARTPKEILAAAKEFYNEMESRKAGKSSEMIRPKVYRPRHIFFDEWAALMDMAAPNYPYTKQERALILAVMTKCVHEYRGFFGYGHISMQNPKESNIGDVLLRNDMPLLLVHKSSDSTCSFLYPGAGEADKRKIVLKLKARQCFVDCRTEERQHIALISEIEDDVAHDFEALYQESGIPTLPVERKRAKQIAGPAPAPTVDSALPVEQQRQIAALVAQLVTGDIPTTPAAHLYPVDENEEDEYEGEEEDDGEEEEDYSLEAQLTGDIKLVYEACIRLEQSGQAVVSRNVGLITGFGKDKCNSLMHDLENMGLIDRKRKNATAQTDKIEEKALKLVDFPQTDRQSDVTDNRKERAK
jgi:hypothetical protein